MITSIVSPTKRRRCGLVTNVRRATSAVTACGFLILLSFLTSQASAQTFTSLYSFSGSDGYSPAGDLTLSGTTLYGAATYSGSGNGSLFRINTDGTGYQNLFTFTGTNGFSPQRGLVLIGSTLYGTTMQGGTANVGNIFSIDVDGTHFQSTLSFNGSNSNNNGEIPFGDLLPSGSTLFGTTVTGGQAVNGTVFKINTNGTGFQTLYTLDDQLSHGGQQPNCGLTLRNGVLYGVAAGGGANGNGTIFTVNTDGTGSGRLFSFSGANGSRPEGTLTLGGSVLYGVTSQGGAYNDGTIFKINTDGTGFQSLLSFNGSDGQGPWGGLSLVGTTLYGMATSGGANNKGTMFKMNTDGTGFCDLLDFNGANGSSPEGSFTVSGSTLFGATFGGGTYNAGTVFSLNISPASIVLGNVPDTMIVKGGTCSISVTVSNPTSSGFNLNYTMGSAVQSGSATLGLLTPSTGSLSPGSSASCSLFATSTTPGKNTISFTAADPNASNLSQSTTATLTVYDHSNASLSSSVAQTAQTISFGNVLRGASLPTQNFSVFNLAVNTTANYTANLKLTQVAPPTGDPAFSTNLSTFSGLTAATGSNGQTFTATLNTGNYTTSGTSTIVLPGSQLMDDSTLPGAGSNNNGAITITLQGNVGNATADASNSQTSFGAALTAPVAQNASYANLESKVTATTGSGGAGMAGTTATILAGTASVSTTASMAWRTAASSPQTGTKEGFVSDVLDLTGIGVVDGQTKDGSVHTDTFVLQMNYDPLAVTARTGLVEQAAAAAGLIQMDYLDMGPDGTAGTADDQWEPAVLGNFGSNNDHFAGVEPWNGDMELGEWGVNTIDHTVWAVLDHNSDFAVVPEPSALVLLGVGAIVLVGFRGRRKLAKGTAQAELQAAAPAILSFSSHSFPASPARRAA